MNGWSERVGELIWTSIKLNSPLFNKIMFRLREVKVGVFLSLKEELQRW